MLLVISWYVVVVIVVDVITIIVIVINNTIDHWIVHQMVISLRLIAIIVIEELLIWINNIAIDVISCIPNLRIWIIKVISIEIHYYYLL